jgi:hypothetical protein
MATIARPPLARLLWLSVAAALATIALKTLAWALTGSVGLLSDAAESVVNLVAALFALVIVHWAARPPDEDHPYGHEKADYLSAGVEGSLILLAGVGRRVGDQSRRRPRAHRRRPRAPFRRVGGRRATPHDRRLDFGWRRRRRRPRRSDRVAAP